MATVSSDPDRPPVPPRPDGGRTNVQGNAPTDIQPSPGAPPTDPSTERPTAKQQQILIAYHDLGNAAAVGRTMGVSERTVRRLVGKYASVLEEWRHEREAQQLAAADALAARMHAWADSSVGLALDRLGDLVASSDDRIALQAIRMTLDVVHRDSISAVQSERETDVQFRTRSRNIIDRLEALEAIPLQAEGDAPNHG